MAAARRPSFNNARVTIVDGVKFASAGEARRWCELQLLERGSVIRDLRRQVPWCLLAGSDHANHTSTSKDMIGFYVADFVYTDCRTAHLVVEDYKGFRTELYRWKKKHFEAQYGITITETVDARRRRKRRARRAH